MRLPGWLVFVIFVPLQIWLFLQLREAWGIWWTILLFLGLGILGARAARASWFKEVFFPRWADRWERRRHIFQGALLIVAGATWMLAWGPQPWVPAASLATLAKAALR